MNSRIEGWLSIPKSLYVCFKLLPWSQAIKMPIKVRYNVRLQSLKGRVILSGKVRKSMVMIGFQYVGTHDVSYRRAVLEIDGTLEFRGSAMIGSGCQLCVSREGRLSFGENMMNTCSGHIVCVGNMRIGKNFLMGWDSLLLDTDFHFLENVDTHEVNAVQRDIIIGDNVWMAARSVVLKGSYVPNGTTIGANSVVAGRFDSKNCVVAGNPARVVKRGYRKRP